MAGNNGSNDADQKKTTSQFASLLQQWQSSDDGSTPFEVAKPKVKSKTSIKTGNEKSIKDYKQELQAKNFKAKTPTRGMSQWTKPAQLQNLFEKKIEDKSYETDYKPPVFKKTKEDTELIRTTIQQNFFFNDMKLGELPAFIEAFEPIEVEKGSSVITQGDLGDFFYIVGKGSVVFQINGDKIGTAEVGGAFGELALLYSCRRAATVTVESSPTTLFRVGRKTFRSLMQKQTKQKECEKIERLKAVDFLKEISDSDRKRLGRSMTLQVFGPGEYLVKKGDEGDTFYIVHEGQVEVTDISVGSAKFGNIVLEPGAYFGERALATKEPRAANVIAKTNGSAFRINRKKFEKVVGKLSRIIMRSQDRKILEGIEMLQLSSLTPKQFEELANLVVDKKFKRGKIIFDTVKRTNAALYIVREGSVKLTGKRSDTIRPGAYFGDDLLLLDIRQEAATGKRASTKTLPEYVATAEEDCLCGMLSLSDCRTIFDTTTMIDPQASREELVDEFSEEFSYEVELNGVPAESTPDHQSRGLMRQTTRQWLTRSSLDGLRRVVKKKIKLDDLEREHILGEGQFGEVHLVNVNVDIQYGIQYFALKSQKKDDPTRGDSVNAIWREINVLQQMDHPFIVGLINHYEGPEHMYILMSLVHGGELFDVIHTENEDGTWSSGLPEQDAMFYAMVVCDTLDYMHRKQFVYRDMKPENVLIDKDGYPIICDFGFAKFVTDKTYTLCGTPNYLSPEIIMNRGHNAACDHWALGVMIYEMVTGESPFYFDGMPQIELFECIVREKFYPLPDDVSDSCFHIVNDLLEKDPNQRLGSLAGKGKDILAMAWFSDLNLDDVRQKKFKAPFIPRNELLEKLVDRPSTSLDLSQSSSNHTVLSGCSVNSMSLLDDSDDET